MKTKFTYPLKRSADYQFNLYSAFIGGLLIACLINSCGSSLALKNNLQANNPINDKVVVVK